MKRCLFCIIRRNKNKSLKCQSCNYFLNTKGIREGVSYLEKGFAKINNELDDIENKVNEIIGIIFKRHKYKADDLLNSSQMTRIKSFAGKIKDDVNQWESSGKLSYHLLEIYNDYAESTQGRFRQINNLIKERKPTLWEHVGNFFTKLYHVIVELLPTIFQKMLTAKKQKYVEMDEEAA